MHRVYYGYLEVDMIKTITFPDNIGAQIMALAESERRSFTAQVLYIVEKSIANNSTQGNELAEYMKSHGMLS